MNTRPTPETDDSKTRVRKNGFSRLIEYCYANDMAKIERELATVTAQRDRLAEALETAEGFMRHDLNCHARIGNGAYKCHCGMEAAQFLAKQALQSLTLKP